MKASPRIRLGMLTPSSNTVLEPVTSAMVADVEGVSAHFARFRVTEIALSAASDGQFEDGARLAAAELLADARCDVIAWSGTSAAWLGFEHDEALCTAIEARTGAGATSSVLANRDLFERHGVTRYALVTPYTEDVQARIVHNHRAAGFECVAERHLGISENFAFGEVGAGSIAEMVRAVATERPDAISIVCTNVAGAPLVEALEAETGVTVYDSAAVVVARSLELAGADPRAVRGWGRLFSMPG